MQIFFLARSIEIISSRNELATAFLVQRLENVVGPRQHMINGWTARGVG